MKCNEDCLNCVFEKCKYDVEEENKKLREEDEKVKETKKVVKDRKQYQHEYYELRKKRDGKSCKWCGKKCHGEMIRIDKKYYCGVDCVKSYLFEKNDKKMKIVYV